MEYPVCFEDGDDGEGVWDWSTCLAVSPILQSQSEMFIFARSSRCGQWEVFQSG
jgi:hypothetical protein